eukprot:m.239061 g.239061  ORF g.239061 m.239061 type:complete len:358 (-) comp13934_c0_seq2:2226-3299(-)
MERATDQVETETGMETGTEMGSIASRFRTYTDDNDDDDEDEANHNTQDHDGVFVPTHGHQARPISISVDVANMSRDLAGKTIKFTGSRLTSTSSTSASTTTTRLTTSGGFEEIDELEVQIVDVTKSTTTTILKVLISLNEIKVAQRLFGTGKVPFRADDIRGRNYFKAVAVERLHFESFQYSHSLFGKLCDLHVDMIRSVRQKLLDQLLQVPSSLSVKLEFVVVVDNSWSMKGDAGEVAIQALVLLLETFRRLEMRIAVLSFAGREKERWLKTFNQNMTIQKGEEILLRLNFNQTGTAIADCVRTAGDHLKQLRAQRRTKERVNYKQMVLLISNGLSPQMEARGAGQSAFEKEVKDL